MSFEEKVSQYLQEMADCRYKGQWVATELLQDFSRLLSSAKETVYYATWCGHVVRARRAPGQWVYEIAVNASWMDLVEYCKKLGESDRAKESVFIPSSVVAIVEEEEEKEEVSLVFVPSSWTEKDYLLFGEYTRGPRGVIEEMS